jgi:hypothetical protein
VVSTPALSITTEAAAPASGSNSVSHTPPSSNESSPLPPPVQPASLLSVTVADHHHNGIGGLHTPSLETPPLTDDHSPNPEVALSPRSQKRKAIADAEAQAAAAAMSADVLASRRLAGPNLDEIHAEVPLAGSDQKDGN